MKKIKIVIAAGSILFICPLAAFCDEKITLSTYYPAPYGEYRTLAVGDTYSAPNPTGTTDLVVEGNVGIGVTNAQSPLHIAGDILFADGATRRLYIDRKSGGIPNDNGNDLVIRAGDAKRRSDGSGGNLFLLGGEEDGAGTEGNVFMAHDGSGPRGNVGIGTTSVGFAKLAVVNGAKDIGSMRNWEQAALMVSQPYTIGGLLKAGSFELTSTYNNSTRTVLQLVHTHTGIGVSDGFGPRLDFSAASSLGGTAFILGSIDAVTEESSINSGSLNFITRDTASENVAMTLKYNGNVGMGTTVPAGKLHVVDNLAIANGILIERNGGSPRLGLVDTSVAGTPISSPAWYIDNNADTFRIFRQPDISTNGTAHLRIDNQGRVGIGWNPSDPTPAGRDSILHIDPTRLPQLVALGGADETLAVISLGPERGHIFRILGSASSKRYKENIKPYKDDFYKILKATPVSFTYKKEYLSKDTPDVECYGYIAEDFDEVGLKNLVGYNENNQPDKINKELIPVYILEVVKAHNTEIENLKNQITKLEKEIEDLKRQQ